MQVNLVILESFKAILESLELLEFLECYKQSSVFKHVKLMHTIYKYKSKDCTNNHFWYGVHFKSFEKELNLLKYLYL